MAGHECHHCKEWIPAGAVHDCWTTTEAALTKDLSDDLRDAWERLRETAAEFGEQRIYASGSCIMFSRASCYFFVRPKRKHLELAVFLGRPITSPQIKRAEQKSKVKIAHIIHLTHRDEVESPMTDWLREAYDFEPLAKAAAKSVPKAKTSAKKKTSKKTSARPKAKKAKKKAKVSRKR